MRRNIILFLSIALFLFSCSSPKQDVLTDPQIDAVVKIDLNHYSGVNTAVFSPDGKQIATSGRDKSLIIWDIETQQQIMTIREESAKDETGSYETLVYSKDGTKLFAGTSKGKIVIFDIEKGEKSKIIEVKKDNSNVLDLFTPRGEILEVNADEKYVLLGGNRNFSVFDIASGNLLKTFQGHTGYLTEVKFNPAGKTIASAAKDSTVRLWDIETGEEIKKIDFDEEVNSIDFNKDGSKLAASVSDNKKIHILDTETQKIVNTIDARAADIAFRGDEIISQNNRETLILNPETGDTIKKLDADGYNFVLSQDLKFLANADSYGVVITDIESGKTIADFGRNVRYASKLHVSPSGKFIVAECEKNSGSGGPDISSFAVDTNYTFSDYHTSGGSKNLFAFHGKKEVIATEISYGDCYFYDLTTGKEVSKTEDKVTDPFSITSDGSLMIAKDKSNSDTYAIFDPLTGEKKKDLVTDDGYHYFSGITPDDKYYALLNMNFFKVWELPAGNEVKSYKRKEMDNIFFIDKMADGKYVVGKHGDNAFSLHDIMTGTEIFKTGSISPNYAALSPDKNIVAVASDDWTVKVFDIKLNKETQTLTGHLAPLKSVTFTPNGKYIISSAQDNQIIIWDAASGAKLLTLIGVEKTGDYEGQTKDFIVFAPNGRYDGTEAAINKYLYFEKAGKRVSVSEYKDKCYTPNLLGKTLGQDFIEITAEKAE